MDSVIPSAPVILLYYPIPQLNVPSACSRVAVQYKAHVGKATTSPPTWFCPAMAESKVLFLVEACAHCCGAEVKGAA